MIDQLEIIEETMEWIPLTIFAGVWVTLVKNKPKDGMPRLALLELLQ